MQFFTIGVYNSSEEVFFEKLKFNNINTFCDIRQRRGVRGSKYSFVNSNRLQQRLNELNINYSHILNLAPTEEIRNLQKESDLIKGEKKSERAHLSEVFIHEYKRRILDRFNFDLFLEILEQQNSNRIVFFCVEATAEACHRSLVAQKLFELYGYSIINL